MPQSSKLPSGRYRRIIIGTFLALENNNTELTNAISQVFAGSPNATTFLEINSSNTLHKMVIYIYIYNYIYIIIYI